MDGVTNSWLWNQAVNVLRWRLKLQEASCMINRPRALITLQNTRLGLFIQIWQDQILVITWRSWKDIALEKPLLWKAFSARWFGSARRGCSAHNNICWICKPAWRSSSQSNAKWVYGCFIHSAQPHGNCGFGGIKMEWLCERTPPLKCNPNHLMECLCV